MTLIELKWDKWAMTSASTGIYLAIMIANNALSTAEGEHKE